MPLPDPLPPAVMVIQDALAVAVQAHPACTVTAIVRPLPPAAGTLSEVGATAKLHVPPACVSANACPAIVSVAARGLVVPFAATLYDTVPLPLPVAPPVIVAHVWLLVADHVQPAGAVTATVPDARPGPDRRARRRDRKRAGDSGLRHRERLAGDRDRARASGDGRIRRDAVADRPVPVPARARP